jgi:hypothetical protein
MWRSPHNHSAFNVLLLLLLAPRREKAFQNEVVRNFGVEVLQRATDAEILTYLLQLVQVGSSSSLTSVESRIGG